MKTVEIDQAREQRRARSSGRCAPAASDRASSTALPEVTYVRPQVVLDPAHIARYAKVCGFSEAHGVPIIYPQLLTFPLVTAFLGSADCPWPALGTVHLGNRIAQHQPLRPGDALRVEMRTGRLIAHEKGQIFTLELHDPARGRGRLGGHAEPAAHRRQGSRGTRLRERARHRCAAVAPGRFFRAARHRAALRARHGRPQSHPSVGAVGPAVRLPAGDRARDVDEGAGAGRIDAARERRRGHGRGGIQDAAVPAGAAVAVDEPRGQAARSSRFATRTATSRTCAAASTIG